MGRTGSRIPPVGGLTWEDVKAKLETEGAKNKAYDSDVDGVFDTGAIPDLSRSKIVDFFDSPFWDNIPDKPETLEDLAPRATLTEYITPSSGTKENAIDRDPTTYVEYQSSSTIENALEFDLGSVIDVSLLICDIGALGVGDFGACRVDIQVSEDGSTWTTIFTTGTISSSSERRYLVLKSSTISLRYILFKVGRGGGSTGDKGALRIYRVSIYKVV